MKMFGRSFFMLVLMISTFCLYTESVFAQSSPASKTEIARCENLTGGQFANLESAPTWVTKAVYKPATTELRAHCEIEAYVNPTVSFGVWMPSENWNGKFLFRGCGGSCGILNMELTCAKNLRDGYACATTDMGHRSTLIDDNWTNNNLQGQVDFGFRSTHVATVAGKAIANAYYSRSADKAYFYGCSTGGRQAMIEAQRFPQDYDGIVSVAPASMGLFGTRGKYSVNPNRSATGEAILSDLKVPLIYKAVLAQCDMNDGVKDGILDPRDCKFDPATLQCKGDNTVDCLTEAEVAVTRKFYERGALPGSELNWIDNWTAKPRPPAPFAQSRGDVAVIETFDNAANPDLRAFKARGGKLIFTHGSTDLVVPGGPSLDYYELATATMGGPEKTKDFFRFFVINGMDHCSGGDGAWGIDYLAALDNWVSKGQAPEKLIGVHPKLGVSLDYYGIDTKLLTPDQIEFSRPYFPHPLRAYYSGKGDPNDAANFVAVLTPPKSARVGKSASDSATPLTTEQLASQISNMIKLSEEAYAKGVPLPPKTVSDRIGKALRRLIYSSTASKQTVANALDQVSRTDLSAPATVAINLIKPEFRANN